MFDLQFQVHREAKLSNDDQAGLFGPQMWHYEKG